MWKPFYFEGNLMWGLVETKEIWLDFLRAYNWDLPSLCKMKSKETLASEPPAFGTYGEYNLLPTLGEWAEKEGIDLKIFLNVYSKSLDWRGRLLSNFSASPFVLDGENFSSVEGFIQGIKFPIGDIRREKAFHSVGNNAKDFSGCAENKFVWWKGEIISYGSNKNRELIERAIRAKFEQNQNARYALLETKDLILIHEVPGSEDIVLPKEVFCDILTRIREEYGGNAEIVSGC